MQIVIDTNTLIRFFTDDIPQKADLVEQLLKEEKHVIIPDVVFPELEYILSGQYQFPKEKILNVFTFLASQKAISITTDVRTAISIYADSKLDIADSIIAAYSLKGKLASFDKDLLKIDNVKPFWK